MKKIVAILLALLLAFSFISCRNDPGGNSGSGGGGQGESGMTEAEQQILSTYGEDIFYFAEYADIASSSVDVIQEIFEAEEEDRAALVTVYNNMSQGAFTLSYSSNTLTIQMTDDGVTFTQVVSGAGAAFTATTATYSSNITLSGKKSDSATIGLEIDLVNNTTTITNGNYKAISFGTDANARSNANACLAEIQALDENGNPTPNPSPGPNPGSGWTDGTASLPSTAYLILLHMETTSFEVTIREPNQLIQNYVYGREGNDRVWAKRWNDAIPQYEVEAEYNMVFLDKSAGIQINDPDDNPDKGFSSYLVYEDVGGTSSWTDPDPAWWHEDGDANWHESIVYWLYDDEDIFDEEYAQVPGANYAGGIFFHYSDLVKPYWSGYLSQFNGKYRIQEGTKTVAGLTCTVYRYDRNLFYISDEDHGFICMKHTVLDNQDVEQVQFEVTSINYNPNYPLF